MSPMPAAAGPPPPSPSAMSRSSRHLYGRPNLIVIQPHSPDYPVGLVATVNEPIPLLTPNVRDRAHRRQTQTYYGKMASSLQAGIHTRAEQRNTNIPIYSTKPTKVRTALKYKRKYNRRWRSVYNNEAYQVRHTDNHNQLDKPPIPGLIVIVQLSPPHQSTDCIHLVIYRTSLFRWYCYECSTDMDSSCDLLSTVLM